MLARCRFLLLTGLLLWSRFNLAQDFVNIEPQEVATLTACPVEAPGDSGISLEMIVKPLSENSFEFSVYPNPAHSVIYLRLPVLPDEAGIVRLSDSKGHVVRQDELPHLSRSFSYTLPDDLPPGAYWLEIESRLDYSKTKLIVCAF